MARKIFIAATGQNTGKTTTSLFLMHLALKKYQRVGFIKPIGPKPSLLRGMEVDKDAALIAQVYGLSKDLRLMSPVVLHAGSTRQVIDGEISTAELQERVLYACSELEKKCDLLIIEGAGHVGVGSVIKLSNARIAKLLNAPVLMVTGGGLGNVVDSVYMNLALFQKEGVDVRAILTNKLIPEKRDTSLDYLRRCFADEPFKVLGGFDYHPLLANPTLRRISNLLELPLHGNKRDTQRIINHVQIGAASTQRVAEILQDSTLLLVTSSRDELLVTMANLYQIPAYRSKIVGLLIPGVMPVSTITQQILERSNIPYLRTPDYSTAELYRIITEDVSKLTAEDTEKLALVRKLAEDTFDFDALDAIYS
jgi:dethiobiotin synthetase